MAEDSERPRLTAVPQPQAPQGGPDPGTLREVMSRFATGITVLTAGGQLGCGMTANSFTSVSLDPPLVLACVAARARIHDAIMNVRSFGVSVLADDQEPVARYFANRDRPTGPAQFDRVDWVPGRRTGAPLLSGALAWLECELSEVHEGGDHAIFLGRVVEAGRAGTGHALLFYSGGFHRIVPPAKSA